MRPCPQGRRDGPRKPSRRAPKARRADRIRGTSGEEWPRASRISRTTPREAWRPPPRLILNLLCLVLPPVSSCRRRRAPPSDRNQNSTSELRSSALERISSRSWPRGSLLRALPSSVSMSDRSGSAPETRENSTEARILKPSLAASYSRRRQAGPSLSMSDVSACKPPPVPSSRTPISRPAARGEDRNSRFPETSRPSSPHLSGPESSKHVEALSGAPNPKEGAQGAELDQAEVSPDSKSSAKSRTRRSSAPTSGGSSLDSRSKSRSARPPARGAPPPNAGPAVPVR